MHGLSSFLHGHVFAPATSVPPPLPLSLPKQVPPPRLCSPTPWPPLTLHRLLGLAHIMVSVETVIYTLSTDRQAHNGG